MQEQHMIKLLNQLVPQEGIWPTSIDGVMLMRADHSVARSPVIQEPTIVIVAQGNKAGYLKHETFKYDAKSYLVISVPMQFECETEVDHSGPMLALSIRIDYLQLSEMMAMMNWQREHHLNGVIEGMYSAPMDNELYGAAIRLLESLNSSVDAKILGAQHVREILYRVLSGPGGYSLTAMLDANGHVHRIQRAIQYIQNHFHRELLMPELAREVGMSTSVFHRSFKSITGSTPIQYIKTMRLHKARSLMVQEGVNAATAAHRVGYNSTSQFNREYKRLFNATPKAEATRLKSQINQGSDTLTDKP